MSSPVQSESYKSAADLSDPQREALAGVLLSLADNKRILGMRYGDWILGAPTLESGIACSAMAQDEWGHGRILYATLKDLGLDPGQLEHERASGEYLSSELLDAPVVQWPDLLALNLLFDAALSVQVQALTDSRYEPIHYKTRKLLEEERFHFEHGRGWALRLSETAAGKEALALAFRKALGPSLRWFGRPGVGYGDLLSSSGIMEGGSDRLRAEWLGQVIPVLAEAGLDELAREAEAGVAIDWAEWNAERRRSGGGGPDADTLARIRGDKNRSMLMD
jgi:phenylacetate-CoA oxygenase PaaI subunit